jgi:predicted kinase
MAVLLMGLPGSGKSVLAIALAERFGLQRVCRDRIRAAMFPGSGNSFAEKRAAFRAALLALEIHCALGRSCVLDGMTLARDRDRRRVQALLGRYGALAIPVFLDCPPALARERVAADHRRGAHPAPDRVPALVDLVAARFDPPPREAYVVDASQPAESVAAQVASLVEARGLQAGVLRRS